MTTHNYVGISIYCHDIMCSHFNVIVLTFLIHCIDEQWRIQTFGIGGANFITKYIHTILKITYLKINVQV